MWRKALETPEHLRWRRAHWAEMKAIGRHSVDRRVVAFLASQSPKSGSYGQNLAALKRAGLIVTAGDGLSLTNAGHVAAPRVEAPKTLRDFHRACKARLKKATPARMLDALIEIFPASMSRSELAVATGQSEKSGSYGQNLAALRAFEFITGSTEIAASRLLFPEGLK